MKVDCNVIFKEKSIMFCGYITYGTCEIELQDLLGKVKLVSVSEFKVLKNVVLSVRKDRFS